MTARASKKHPYAAIEHRVIDSDAYADLTFSARSMLVLLSRQLNKDNNGHLQATSKYMKPLGFGSERTICRAIQELITHGFVCRTRMGGYQQGASKYAVTWLSITKKEGIFLAGFKPCAWREWAPNKVLKREKTPPAKLQPANCENGILNPTPSAKNAANRGAKNADNELLPYRAVVYRFAQKRQLDYRPSAGRVVHR